MIFSFSLSMREGDVVRHTRRSVISSRSGNISSSGLVVLINDLTLCTENVRRETQLRASRLLAGNACYSRYLPRLNSKMKFSIAPYLFPVLCPSIVF